MIPLQDTLRKPHIPSVYIHENLTYKATSSRLGFQKHLSGFSSDMMEPNVMRANGTELY